MARRITVKKILSGIPNITKLTGFSDVNDSGLSETNGFLRYDSDNQNFKFVSLSSITSGVSSVNSATGDLTIAGAGTVSVGTVGTTITITGSGGAGGGVDSAAVSSIITADVDKAFVDALNVDADTLDNQNGTYYLDYGNFTNTPTIPTVDSATIQPLARAAIVAGSNITYDSSTGVISSTGGAGGGLDSAAVNSLIAAADTHDSAAVLAQINATVDQTFIDALDTHDSAAVSGQITGTVTQSFINNLNVDAETLGGNDSTYYLNYNNFTNTPTIPTVDSATIRPLARAAIVAGSNITYDSATGVIASTASGGTDSATVVSIADSRIGVASIGDLSDVDLTGVSTNNVLKWDGAKFVTAVDATGSGGAGIALTDLSANDAGGFGSFAYNNVSGVFTYTGADSADVKTVTNIPYSNLTGTPTIPTVDSATIRPLARAAIVAGTNITYDSATGVISSTDTGIDSTAVNTLIAAADTHDSALIQAQIDSSINNDIVGTANEVEVTASGGVATIGLPAAVQITTSLTVGGNNVLTTASDTHDSAAVLGQINTKFANDATFSKDLNVDSNLTVGGYIGGPAVFTIDPAAIGDSTGKVVILGDLQVDGTTTTINSTTVSISDKNIVLADSAVTATQANGAGITINGASATLQYASTGDKWVFNKAPFYNTDRLLTTADDTHDSAAVQGQIDSAVTIAFINSLTGTLDADTLGGNDSAYYLNYNNFTNTPTIPTVDSATIRPLARAAIVQGDNITYDSSTGVISADIGDTHDSAAVSGQINNEVDQNFLQNRIRFDNNKPLRFGDDSDFTIVHNGSHTVLRDKGTGSLYIEGSKIHLSSENNGNPIFLTTGDGDGVKVFDSTGDLRLHARDTGIHTYSGLFVDGNSVLTTVNATSYLKSDEKDQKTAGSLVFNDAVALKFGTDSDHSIAEASGNLNINTAGTSLLKINTAGLRIHNAAGTENLIHASEDGAVTLYYDNAQKAITRSDGFEVTGHLISDSVQTTHIDIFGEVTHKPTPQNAGAGQTTVKSLPHNNVPCSITYNVHMKDINGTTTKGETSFTTIVCTLDSDLDTSFTEFATLFTGDSEFGTFVVEADATNIDLKFTRRSTRDGTIRVAAAKTVVL